MRSKTSAARAELVTEPAVVRSGSRPDRTIARLLALGAVGEGAAGLVLMTYPAVAIRWLLGAELSAAGTSLGRLTGFALFALGVACWSGARDDGSEAASVRAMLTYGVLVTIYLLALGFSGVLVGILLWPAAAAHAVFTFLLARACVVPGSVGQEGTATHPTAERGRSSAP
jgi:hypothetical protein